MSLHLMNLRASRAPRRTALATAGVLALAGASAGLAAAPAHAAGTPTLVVQANQPFRTVTHVASGSLYGLATATVPADSLVEPLKPNTFVQMPAGGHQQAQGDILQVAPEAARAGAKVVDRLSDYYAGWPYQFSWSSWPTVVSQQIQQVKASGITNLASYELWNEPDNTWLSANGTFNSFWTTTYKQVRSLAPGVPIQGPSFSDNISGMQSFLQNAVATSTVPDIISWHELESSSKIAGDVADVEGLEKSLGISPRPIAIEEYAAPSQVGVPGALVGYIAEFERLGINNAELAFWNGYGALGDVLTGTGGSPNGAYWLYDWYGAMSGNMVTTVPSGSGLDGAASVPAAADQVNVIFGGGSGSTAVTVNGLSSLSGFSGGSQVTATLQYTPSPGRTTAVAAPTTVSSSTYTISNGSITVPVAGMNSAYGYHLVITPGGGGGTTLSGTYQIKNAHSGLALDTQNSGTSQGALAVQATASSSSTQSWTLVSAGNGEYKIQNAADGLVLGITNESTSNGADALVWGDNGTPDHLWQFASAGSGEYKIVNANSGKVLGVTNESTASGAQVLQWDDNGTPDHLWTLTQR
ncbi:MAG TPA: RICIN domain-containing protein [Actinospica sp.]|nr:RICIN domain-containing protein [Actinospica sp.]